MNITILKIHQIMKAIKKLMENCWKVVMMIQSRMRKKNNLFVLFVMKNLKFIQRLRIFNLIVIHLIISTIVKQINSTKILIMN